MKTFAQWLKEDVKDLKEVITAHLDLEVLNNSRTLFVGGINEGNEKAVSKARSVGLTEAIVVAPFWKKTNKFGTMFQAGVVGLENITGFVSREFERIKGESFDYVLGFSGGGVQSKNALKSGI